MVAIITGDIMASRKLKNQEKWLIPLKNLFNKWGDSPKEWKLDRGDFFQVEVAHPEDALKKAIEIKALIKKVEPLDERKKISTINVRMAIGIGEKSYSAENISESNGSAFINSGEKFDLLKKENTTLGIKTPWKDFNEEVNIFLKLVGIFMDRWSVSSAELVDFVLKNPKATQDEIGQKLGIKQSAVSRRWNRANINEMLEVEELFRKKIKTLV